MSRSSTLLSREELKDLGQQLRANIDLKDRRHRLKSYPATFLGCVAVAWLMKSQKMFTTLEALQLGNRMIREHIFHHVYDDHLLENSKLFFRFYEDEPAGGGPGSLTSFKTKLISVGGVGVPDDNSPVDSSDSNSIGGEGKGTGSGEDVGLGKLLSTQQQLIQFRLESQGTIARLEETLIHMQESINIQISEQISEISKRTKTLITTLLRVVVILCMVVAVLAFWQPLIPGWFGYFTVLACVLCGFWQINASISRVVSLYDISVLDLMLSNCSNSEINSGVVGSRSANARTTTTTTTREIEREEDENDSSDESRRSRGRAIESKAATMSRLPPITSWMQPLVLRTHDDQILYPNQVRQTYSVDNEYFEGEIVVLIKNLPCHHMGSPASALEDRSGQQWQQQQDTIDNYFQGHRRVTANYVQGRFKKNFLLSEIMTGQTFDRPLQNLPSSFFTRAALGFLKTIAPGWSHYLFCVTVALISTPTLVSFFSLSVLPLALSLSLL
jgi:hypothetical protein